MADALARGGRAVVGGPASVDPPVRRPVVLIDVPEDPPAVSEETFGPTLTVTRVRDVDEGVERANAVRLRARRRGVRPLPAGGMSWPGRMRSGMTSVNSVIAFAIVPGLPFGGVGESGFGRIHGADGLREFTRPKAITRQRMRPPFNVLSFGRTDRDMRRLLALVTLVHGRLYKPRGRLGPGFQLSMPIAAAALSARRNLAARPAWVR